MSNINIENSFTYHPPTGYQVERYQQIRDKAKMLATEIEGHCPESAEKTLAIRKLQEAVMWANASIAINESQG